MTSAAGSGPGRDGHKDMLSESERAALLARIKEVEWERDIALEQLERTRGRVAWRLLTRAIEVLVPPGSRRSRFYRSVKTRLRRSAASGRHGGPESPATLLGAGHSQLSLPVSSEPVVSVVIAADGRAPQLGDCLRALGGDASRVAFEVVVVHNEDLTASDIGALDPGVRAVSSTTDEGSRLSMLNVGAQESRGEFVLFLDYRCAVGRGTLDALANTALSDPSVGAVGGKLVLLDDSLLQAGGIVFNDGSTKDYGRSGDRRSPAAHFVREVDYCSTDCLLVRRAAFEAIGGFEEVGTPSPYDAADLAFRLKERDLKVLYQPGAEARDLAPRAARAGSGDDRAEAERSRFEAKWTDRLKRDHLPPGTDPAVARYRAGADLIVVADHHVPTHDQDSGSKRMRALIDLLMDMGYALILLPSDRKRADPYARELEQAGVEVLCEGIDIREHLSALAPAVKACILSRPEVATEFAELFRQTLPSSKLIYDSVDLHFRREERRLNAKGKESTTLVERLKQSELEAAKSCDAVIAISEDEAEFFASELPGMPVHVIPNIHDDPAPETRFKRRDGLLFVGSFHHSPNVDAVRFFVSEIMPEVRRMIPHAVLRVVGGYPPADIRALEGDDVQILGWVKDLRPLLESSKVAVAPLTYGAGVKGKVGESMGSGLPTVMTSVAAEGLGITDGVHGFITDDPKEFADRVVLLWGDPDVWQQISTKGREFVVSNYSSERAAQRLNALLGELLGDIRPSQATR